MNLSEESINAVALILTGDNDKSPYMSGPKLVYFFREFGFSDIYGQGFPTRIYYSKENLLKINNKKLMRDVIYKILDNRRYIDTAYNVNNVIEYLNTFFKYDGYKVN